MPNVTFNYTRSAGDSNYIYWSGTGYQIGPNSGSSTFYFPPASSYGLNASGSGPGSCVLKVLNSTTVGLDDRQGAGADNDWNDMIMQCSSGSFSGNQGSVFYNADGPIPGCTDPNAANYNPNAQADDGSCWYYAPTANLSASPSALIRGSQWVTLTYGVGNANNANIQPGVGSVSTSGGTVTVNPSLTTVYTLQANGFGGTTTADFTVTVYQPVTVSLTLSPTSVALGNSATLTWVSGGDVSSLNITNIGGVPTSSTTTVTPTTTTTYTATASGNGGTASQSVTLTVYQPPVFNINGPSSINFKDPLLVTYNSTNVNEIICNFELTYNDDTVGTFTETIYGSGTHQPTIPWDDTLPAPFGPKYIKITYVATGDGGTTTEVFGVHVNIDTSPDPITIPATEGVEPDDEVESPDNMLPTLSITVEDIDIPVEIKSDQPIKVEIDDSGTWQEIRPIS